jgi:hypothetical protein
MKTTLKILMLLLGAGYAAAAFAGLIGIATPAVFHDSSIALSVFAIFGLLLIGASDHGRRPVVTGSTPSFPVRALVSIEPGRRSRAYGIRRRAPVAA